MDKRVNEHYKNNSFEIELLWYFLDINLRLDIVGGLCVCVCVWSFRRSSDTGFGRRFITQSPKTIIQPFRN